jgi:hypothetical protein
VGLRGGDEVWALEMMNRKLVVVGGLQRVLSRSPVAFAVTCALVLASFSFFNSNKFQSHYGVLRVAGAQGLRQIYEPETFRLSSAKRMTEQLPGSSEGSVKSLKQLVRDAVDRGIVVIVNASDADAARVLADHTQGARLDISGALDGPTGEILVEVMQELRNVDEMANEVAELKRKLKLYETKQGTNLATMSRIAFHRHRHRHRHRHHLTPACGRAQGARRTQQQTQHRRWRRDKATTDFDPPRARSTRS